MKVRLLVLPLVYSAWLITSLTLVTAPKSLESERFFTMFTLVTAMLAFMLGRFGTLLLQDKLTYHRETTNLIKSSVFLSVFVFAYFQNDWMPAIVWQVLGTIGFFFFWHSTAYIFIANLLGSHKADELFQHDGLGRILRRQQASK
jgi:hypothetical protein